MWVDVDVALPYAAGELLARVRERGTVELDYGEREVRVHGRVSPPLAGELDGRGARAGPRRPSRRPRASRRASPPSDDRPDPAGRLGPHGRRGDGDLDDLRGAQAADAGARSSPTATRSGTRSCSRPIRSGRFSHLELAAAAGLWTLHPEGDGTLHGNHVDPRGDDGPARHGLAFGPDDWVRRRAARRSPRPRSPGTTAAVIAAEGRRREGGRRDRPRRAADADPAIRLERVSAGGWRFVPGDADRGHRRRCAGPRGWRRLGPRARMTAVRGQGVDKVPPQPDVRHETRG